MTLLQLIFHVFNFVLPALAMAVVMPWAGQWVLGRSKRSRLQRMAWHVLAGVTVLLTGLVVLGQDGAMGTYAALVLVSASVEWTLQRAWQA